MLFDTFDATDLNKELKSLMDGLSVKVRRGGAPSSGTQDCVGRSAGHNVCPVGQLGLCPSAGLHDICLELQVLPVLAMSVFCCITSVTFNESTFCCMRCSLALQVFRTYNASITLDRLLFEMEEGGGVGHHGQSYCSRTLEAKKADYDRANKEVSPRLGA